MYTLKQEIKCFAKFDKLLWLKIATGHSSILDKKDRSKINQKLTWSFGSRFFFKRE